MGLELLKNTKIEDIKGIHLFHHPASNNAFRARLLLEEKRLKWESHIVHLNRFEQFSPEYLQINPQGSVPALIHNGTAIYGSENILYYLEKVVSTNCLTPYPELENEMWNWVKASTRTHIDSIVYFLYSKKFGRPARRDKLELYKKLNYEKYKFLIEKGYHMSQEEKEEAYTIVQLQMLRLEEILQGHEYILGDQPSIADIAWLPNVLFLHMLKFNLNPYPMVEEWVKRMQQRPSYNSRSEMANFAHPLVKLYFKFLLTHLPI